MSTSNRFVPNTRLLAVSAAVISVFATYSAEANAAGQHDKEMRGMRKSGSMESMVFGQHHQHKALSPAERMPKQASTSTTSKVDYSKKQTTSLQRPSLLKANLSVAEKASAPKGVSKAAVAACDRAAFASASGSALVNLVKSSSTDCINDLFGVSGSQAAAIFKESQMVSVANAFRTAAASYDGTNSSSIEQMVMFLRAGYYVQWYDTSVGTYGATLTSAVQGALDAFSSNANFGLINDVHGEILGEVVTLVDSSGLNARYLNSIVKRMLTLNNSYLNYWWMRGAVNNAFTVLFRGHQNADFQALVKSDTSIVDTLYNFMNTNWGLLGTDNEYLVANASRELGRFLQYAEGSALKSIAKSRVKTMVDRSSVTGNTAPVWIGLGEMVDYYDKANCSYYNMCDFQTKLDTTILPIKYNCSPTLRLKAQSLTTAQLQEACNIVGGEEGYFHQQVQSGNVPVAKDNNTQLEMVIFSSSADYGRYAGALYGIDTNNGGMYLEGDPSVVGNQPRFIAYQAEWMLPKFEIWNLTHEYIHYLDGRFNMWGDFNDGLSVPKTIWWIEGFAEYISYSYRKLDYTDAKNQAATGAYRLSDIFANDYNSGQTRVYNWGYLAVRYMFEKQRSKVSSVLGYFRPGNYTGYSGYINSIGTSLDSDFANWLPCVNNASLPQCTGTTPPVNSAPVAAFNSSANGLTVAFTDTSTDSDGTIASRSWNFGDGTTSTAANPSKTYSAAGTYTVTLKVTDNAGASTTTSKTVTVSATQTNKPPVAAFNSTASGLTVNFTDASTDADGTIASRSWNFGDGTTSTAANPSKTYAAAGTYTVTLTVKDNAGASTTVSKTVTVNAGSTNKAPVAAFTSTVSGLKATFTDGSTDADGTIASRSWNFGDGTTSTAANPSKTYAAAGTYTVTLTVKDNAGASATTTQSVTVTSGGTSLPECTGSAEVLGKNCVRSNLSATAGNYVYMYINVPAGTPKLTITTSGGTGNADLFVSTLGTWATRDYYNYGSYKTGNAESVVINNPPAGYVFVSLYATTNFSGVKVTTQY
ncbi:collagenase [Undibacterium squillarum]|uniref:collagenase n=1 Tax=Undibacterium squillarum TaxID=1131567 RepID=UPI0035B16773